MLEWWHWVVFGLALSIIELLVPAFFVIWFGIAAVGVGLILLFLPELSAAMQIVLWGLASAALVALWFRYFRPRTVTAVGTSTANVIGEVGVLVNELTPHSRGQVRFQRPVLGADIWECYAETPIKAGERVRIAAVEGNFVRVETCK